MFDSHMNDYKEDTNISKKVTNIYDIYNLGT